ncbi:MAG: hypothetical protein ACREL5_04790 [Gemmatimonadales bacterium]
MKYPTTPRRPARRVAEARSLLARHQKKVKASLTLSGELVEAADLLAGPSGRSALVEEALRQYLEAIIRRARDEQDLDAINRAAEKGNRESDALLGLQEWPE